MGLWFLSQRRPRPWRRDMAALGSISADVRHKAAPPGPRRSPPALGVPWGHVPPIWRPGGPCRCRHDALNAAIAGLAVVGGRLIWPPLSPIWPTHAPEVGVRCPYTPQGPRQPTEAAGVALD